MLEDIALIQTKLDSLNVEQLVLLADYLGSAHAHVLERIEPGLSVKRKKRYKKHANNAQCACGGKQKPSYLVNDIKVCQRCYIKSKN